MKKIMFLLLVVFAVSVVGCKQQAQQPAADQAAPAADQAAPAAEQAPAK